MSFWKNPFWESASPKEKVVEEYKEPRTMLLIERLDKDIDERGITTYEMFLLKLYHIIEQAIIDTDYFNKDIYEEYDWDKVYKHFTDIYHQRFIFGKTNTIGHILSQFRDFAKFLIVADALLLYNNDDSENMRSVVESKDNIKLMMYNDDYNVGFCFTKDFARNNDKNLLEEFLDEGNKDNSLLYIEIKRLNGSQTKTCYNISLSTANEGIKFDTAKDEILFRSVVNNTIANIEAVYNRILNNSFHTYTGIKTDKFDWREFLYGFRI